MNNKLYIIVLTSLLLTSCEFIRQRQLGDAVVKIGNEALYEQDIQRIIYGATDSIDSARLVNQYLQQWGTEVIEYNKARKQLGQQPEIEQLVEQYKRQLYIQEYERELIANRMPKYIDSTAINDFYQTQIEHFTLRETLLKGLLLIVPIDAPDMITLKKNLNTINDEALEKIEKYAYQYATGYELFIDNWQTEQNILLLLPTTQQNLTQQLHKDLIEISDSTQTYLLRITDKRIAGETMPIEYAQPKIEEMILSRRQQSFIKDYKKEIYNQSQRNGTIKIKKKKNNE